MNRVYIHRCEGLYDKYMDAANEALIRTFCDVVSGGSRKEPVGHDALVEQMKGAEVILSNCRPGSSDITNEVLRNVGSVKLIVVCHPWNQFADLDLGSLGIRMIEGSNASTVAVAEWVLSAALMGVRRIGEFDRRLKSGSLWCEPNKDQSAGMLKGKKVGLIGLGRIGRYVARLFKAFGAIVLVYDDFVPERVFIDCGVKRGSLEEVFSTSDIISLHLAVTPSTRNTIGRREFGLIKDGAIFLNFGPCGALRRRRVSRRVEKSAF